jgi:4-alpha-glucanotransferase
MADRPHLHALAERAGILRQYTDLDGKTHDTSDKTYIRLLAAMGFDAASEEAAHRALQKLDDHARERLLPPVRVIRQSAAAETPISAAPRRESRAGTIDWHIGLRCEDGVVHLAQGRLDTTVDPLGTLRLPFAPCLGYHELHLTVRSGSVEHTATQRLIVVPDRCRTADELLGDRRVFGVIANLYSLRSDRNWGVGDLTDLANLAGWAGRKGAAFLGLNPLHALRNAGFEVSPYSPVSRLFRNVIYLDPTAVPEFASSPAAREAMGSARFQESLARIRDTTLVAYRDVAALKLEVLRLLFADFRIRHDAIDTPRGRQYAAFCTERGPALDRYATFLALEDHFARKFGRPRDWRAWPPAYRRPDSPAVEEFRRSHAPGVEFHKYVQFELDRQLAAAAAAARAAGMTLGLNHDLAIGAAAGGADTWANPGLFVDGARLGAPPDDYARTGQDWGLPPIHPLRLIDNRYEYWTQLLRANLAHGGALRIDHVMGLLRQYWIPPGATAIEGAYVRYPADDLFGILALESVRHNALVIGEDLGTVPDGFTKLLEQWGLLSCQVMYFQRDARGEFLSSSAYSPRALVTSTTHDHVPLAGYVSGDDLRIRRRIGSVPDDHTLARQLQQRQVDGQALRRRLESEIPESAPLSNAAPPQLCAAVHRFLAKTPAPLVGVLLDDLTGEREPVNFPGVGPERHPSWSRRMTMPIEQLEDDPAVAMALSGVAARMPD